MPEGDTVYRAAARLRDALAGRTLIRSDFRVPRFATFDLSGQVVDSVASRGKHLLIRVGEVSIHSHLKMEGEWRVFRPGELWSRPAHQARVILQTDALSAVGFAGFSAFGFACGTNPCGDGAYGTGFESA